MQLGDIGLGSAYPLSLFCFLTNLISRDGGPGLQEDVKRGDSYIICVVPVVISKTRVSAISSLATVGISKKRFLAISWL